MPRRRHPRTNGATLTKVFVGLVFLVGALALTALILQGAVNAWLGIAFVLGLVAVAIALVVSHIRQHARSKSDASR